MRIGCACASSFARRATTACLGLQRLDDQVILGVLRRSAVNGSLALIAHVCIGLLHVHVVIELPPHICTAAALDSAAEPATPSLRRTAAAGRPQRSAAAEGGTKRRPKRGAAQ